MLVKCKICGNKIEKNEAFKVVIKGKNNYYCNNEEYNNYVDNLKLKDNTYQEIFNIFNRKITNTTLFKEINELAKIYTYEKILSYLKLNSDFLNSIMNKDFTSEYAQIRYFSAILKNNLSDFKIENTSPNKKIVVDIPKDNFKSKKRKKSINDFEMEVD